MFKKPRSQFDSQLYKQKTAIHTSTGTVYVNLDVKRIREIALNFLSIYPNFPWNQD